MLNLMWFANNFTILMVGTVAKDNIVKQILCVGKTNSGRNIANFSTLNPSQEISFFIFRIFI